MQVILDFVQKLLDFLNEGEAASIIEMVKDFLAQLFASFTA